MPTACERLDSMRTSFRALGPLRPIAVYLAIVPTAGTLFVLAHLPAVRAALPASAPAAFAGMALGIAAVAAGSLALPSAGAFAAGYCLGAAAGTMAALLGAGFGSLLLQRFVLPRLGAAVVPFMRERPRAAAMRRLCGGGSAAAILGVARLRWAALFPLAATNLLCAAAEVPGRAVLLGNLGGALPGACLAALAGDGWRSFRESGRAPGAGSLAAAAAALAAAILLRRTARRAWREAASPGR